MEFPWASVSSLGPATRLWVAGAGAGGDVDITAVGLVKGGREKGGKG